MMRHDELQLWPFAARELDVGESRSVAAHLEECPECVEQLAAVQVAQEALELARSATPRLTWARMDERIGHMVEKRLAAQARRPLYWRLGFVGGGLALAAVAALVVLSRPAQAPVPLDEQPVAPVAASWARIDRAQGLTRVDGQGSELTDGTELRGGDVLRTVKAGRAFVHLPDGSHVRVGGASQLALTRSEADDVALTLERGTLAVRASHQQRKGFVVHTGGLTVNVVGTVFGVTNDAGQVEVAVSEGRVRVELPSGEATVVDAGQRLRFEAKTQRMKRLRLSPANERELSEVAAVADAATSVEQRAVVPAAGGKPSAPPMLAAQGASRSLPRLSVEEARSRQVAAPVVEAPAPAAAPAVEEKKLDVVIEEPDGIWPSIGGGEVVRGMPAMRQPEPQVEAPPVSQPAEWAEAPKAAVDEWSAMPRPEPQSAAKLAEEPAVTAPAPPARKSLEAVFLDRAAASVEQGTCERFLAGLEDLAAEEKGPRAEQARVLRARCFDAQMRPRQAVAEYRRYLEAWPQGRFAAEAQQAIGD
jgi:hypothetical protein